MLEMHWEITWQLHFLTVWKALWHAWSHAVFTNKIAVCWSHKHNGLCLPLLWYRMALLPPNNPMCCVHPLSDPMASIDPFIVSMGFPFPAFQTLPSCDNRHLSFLCVGSWLNCLALLTEQQSIFWIYHNLSWRACGLSLKQCLQQFFPVCVFLFPMDTRELNHGIVWSAQTWCCKRLHQPCIAHTVHLLGGRALPLCILGSICHEQFLLGWYLVNL